MIRLREKIGYGLGDMSSSMFWKIFGAYLMIFYTDVFGLPAAVVGTMFAVTRVWDSVFDPFVGVVADRTTTRMGKFRPYLLWLAIPFALIGVLTFVTPSFGMQGKIVYAYFTYTLMMMVYSAINVPYASLLGVISPEATATCSPPSAWCLLISARSWCCCSSCRSSTLSEARRLTERWWAG